MDTQKRRLPCCVSKPISDKSEDIQSIQSKMIANESVDSCAGCYKKEANQEISSRQYANKHFLLNWADLADKLFDEQNKPVWYDLRFSNLCNLECQICNAQNSSKIAERLGKENKLLSWEPDIEINPEARKIYLSGGEPFLIEKFNHILNQVTNTDCNIEINTNGTVLTDHLLTALDRFHKINFIISVDGYGVLNERVRKNSNWNDLCNNIALLRQRYSNIDLIKIHTVIQHDNINQLLDIGKWITENNFSKWTLTTLAPSHHLHHSNVDSINIPDELFKIPTVHKDHGNVALLKSIIRDLQT
jgi:sulfatase maturation enzyme AslB (radical SAM superfamily)